MRLNLKSFQLGAVILTGFLFYTSCTTDDSASLLSDEQIEARGPINGFIPNTALIGLSPDNQLVHFSSGPPAQDMGTVPITGLRNGEFVLAIDTRPRTNELYGVTSMNNIYVIEPDSGVATLISAGPLTPAVSGAMVGFDFDPVTDVIRLITDSGQNLRISPVTGAVVGVDININSFTAAINSIAYTYPSIGFRSTLYDIDIADGLLYRQTAPNTGALRLVGPVDYLWSGDGGFEITRSNIAFTVQYGHSRFPKPDAGGTIGGGDDSTQDAYRLYYINLKTGLATSHGKVRPMIGLAAR